MPKNVGQHNRSPEAIVAQIKTARVNGEALEDGASRAAMVWRETNVAKVRKSYPTGRSLGGYGGTGGSAPVDFTGEFCGTGQKIAFECKNLTRTATYPHDKDRMHQLTYLRRIRKHGGLAFLLLYDSGLGVAYLATDLDTLATGKSLAVRAVGRDGTITHRLPTTRVLRTADGLTFPDLLVDAQLACEGL